MFTRLQRAVFVLRSGSGPKQEQQGIVFEELRPQKISRPSAVIASFVGVLAIATIAAFVGRTLGSAFEWPNTASFGTMIGALSAVIAFLGNWCVHAIQNHLNSEIGKRIGPSFGHKITEAIAILRS